MRARLFRLTKSSDFAPKPNLDLLSNLTSVRADACVLCARLYSLKTPPKKTEAYTKIKLKQLFFYLAQLVHRLVASPQSKQNSDEHGDNTNFDRGAGALVALRRIAARCFAERAVTRSAQTLCCA